MSDQNDFNERYTRAGRERRDRWNRADQYGAGSQRPSHTEGEPEGAPEATSSQWERQRDEYGAESARYRSGGRLEERPVRQLPPRRFQEAHRAPFLAQTGVQGQPTPSMPGQQGLPWAGGQGGQPYQPAQAYQPSQPYQPSNPYQPSAQQQFGQYGYQWGQQPSGQGIQPEATQGGWERQQATQQTPRYGRQTSWPHQRETEQERTQRQTRWGHWGEGEAGGPSLEHGQGEEQRHEEGQPRDPETGQFQPKDKDDDR